MISNHSTRAASSKAKGPDQAPKNPSKGRLAVLDLKPHSRHQTRSAEPVRAKRVRVIDERAVLDRMVVQYLRSDPL